MQLESTLKSHKEKFKEELKKTCHRPTPHQVHHLRVLTRKLRVDFWLVPKKRRTRAIRKCRQDLEYLGDVLGRQRKYDVALRDSLSLGRGTRRIKACVKETRKDVLATLRKKRRKSYFSHLNKALDDFDSVSPKNFAEQLRLLRRQLQRALAHPPKTTDSRHRLRVHLKKARYILQAFGKEDESLKKIQDALGRWHDLAVLATLSDCSQKVRDREKAHWKRAERLLRPTLRNTIEAISQCIADLR